MSTEAFVPLAAARAANAVNAGFRPLHTDSPMAGQVPGAGPAAAAAPVCKPSVLVSRDKDRVTAIQVRCSCGQVIDLVCSYPG